MLHTFFEPGDWFAPRRYGIGAGRPIAWQGWVLVASFLLVVLGLAQVAKYGDWMISIAGMALIFVTTAGFIFIVHKRTRGGWRWRWGGEE
jgi:hypothetical protein